MNELKLNVFLNLTNSGIEDVLRTVVFPSDIKITFCDMFDDAFGYCLLLTESVDEASAFKSAGGSKARLYSVYIGDSKSCENRCDSLDDIWPVSENANITKTRFKKIVGNIKAVHDAWFFKNLYFTALDSVPSLCWCKDLEGRHYNVNQHFSQTVRKSKEECEGKDHYQIWNVDPAEHASGELICVDSEDLVLTELRTIRLEENLETLDGRVKLMTYKSPVFNEFGEVIGTVGVANDITALSNVKHENSLLVESVPFPVIVCDSNWKTVMMNGTMRRLLNLSGPVDKFDYQTWKKYFLTPVSEPSINEEHHYVNQIFAAVDNRVPFQFQINEQDIRDVFDNLTGYIVIPRKLGPNGEMLGVPEA